MSEKEEPKNLQTQKKFKTEKVLVVLAILLLLLSAGSLYFDDWLWSGLRSRDKVIGVITNRSGDVRLKFDQDVSWQKASQGQALQYNDSIFAGQDSQAELKLGQSDLTVTQNSLVVLRREMDANFLNLNYGTLFGQVAKNDKIYIDTGSGKATMLKTDSQAKIVLKKVGEQTSLQVVSGKAEVEIDGVRRTIDENSEILLPKKKESDQASAPTPPPVPQKLELKILPPSPTGITYDKNPKEFTFQWQYGDQRPVSPADDFKLEFSKSPDFSDKVLSRPVRGLTSASLTASNSNQLYYRVRGPQGELSTVENFSFVRMAPPVVIKPTPEMGVKVPYRGKAVVDFELKRDKTNPNIWSQIGTDESFETVLVNESGSEDKWEKSIPAGRYFFRARSDFGNNKLSDWSKVVPFNIDEEMDQIKVPNVGQMSRQMTIQNLNYPPRLYGASDEETKQFLFEKGFARDFFADLKPYYDQLSVDFGDGQNPSQIKDSSLPVEKIYPSTLSYRYQLQKAGMLPSPWSQKEQVQIQLEPPKETGVEVVFEKLKNDGMVPVKIGYTPLLFAKNYEFQVATNSGFSGAKVLTDEKTFKNIKLSMKQDYFWRVRALDQNKKPLSGYSAVRKLSASEFVNQIRLAKKESKARQPAAVEESVAQSRTQQRQVMEYQRDHNFWAWFGTGYNYVNYKQVYADRGDLGSASKNDNLGQFIEVGYKTDRGFGAVVGYKNTPGEVVVQNANLDQSKYEWKTVSLEGILLKTSKFRPFGKRLDYGPRLGVQSHTVPYVFLNENDDLELKQNNITTASIGLMGDLINGRWKVHSYMRYQLPLSASSGGASEFNIKSKVTFDGLIGTSYYFNPQFKAGLFWYGQWLYYQTLYSDGVITNTGDQSLFYSNMDFRFGFEF